MKELHSALDTLGKLKKDWNGYDGNPVSQIAIRRAKEFIDAKCSDTNCPITVSQDGDGAVMLISGLTIITIDDQDIHVSSGKKGSEVFYGTLKELEANYMAMTTRELYKKYKITSPTTFYSIIDFCKIERKAKQRVLKSSLKRPSFDKMCKGPI